MCQWCSDPPSAAVQSHVDTILGNDGCSGSSEGHFRVLCGTSCVIRQNTHIHTFLHQSSVKHRNNSRHNGYVIRTYLPRLSKNWLVRSVFVIHKQKKHRSKYTTVYVMCLLWLKLCCLWELTVSSRSETNVQIVNADVACLCSHQWSGLYRKQQHDWFDEKKSLRIIDSIFYLKDQFSKKFFYLLFISPDFKSRATRHHFYEPYLTCFMKMCTAHTHSECSVLLYWGWLDVVFSEIRHKTANESADQ